MNKQDAIEQLNKAGLLQSHADLVAPTTQEPMVWYLRVLSAFSGWLSALYVLAFLGTSAIGIFDYEEVCIGLGLLLFSGAVLLLKQNTNDFANHMGIAVSLAGQALFMYGFTELVDTNAIFGFATFTLFNVIALALVSQYEHRFISTVLSASGMAGLFAELHIENIYTSTLLIGVGLIWMYELPLNKYVKYVRAIAYGLTLCLIQFKTSAIFIGQGVYSSEALPALNPLLDEIFNAVVMLVLLVLITTKSAHRLLPTTRYLLLSIAVVFASLSIFANGLSVSLVLLLLAVKQSDRNLLTLGVLAGVINLSSYYYLVDYTLLQKSLLLVLVGLVCGVVAFIAGKLPQGQEASHA